MNNKHLLLLTGLLTLGLCPPLAGGPVPTAAQEKPAKKLEVRVYGSLIRDVSDTQARAITRPVVDLLARRLNYGMAFDIERGTSAEDLLAFGKKLNDGTYHLGVLWGIEYGWLLQKYPDLTAMVVASNGDRAPWRSQLMIRRQTPVPSLDKLKGKRLAQIKGAPLMDQLFLDSMIRAIGQDPRTFFRLGKPLSDARSAFRAVKNGEADCVVINLGIFSRLKDLQPKFAQNLIAVDPLSDPYPPPVMIGRIKHMESLRPRLWRTAQEEVIRIHETEEGKQCVNFWRFDAFIKPDKEFMEQVKQSARKFPLKNVSKGN